MNHYTNHLKGVKCLKRIKALDSLFGGPTLRDINTIHEKGGVLYRLINGDELTRFFLVTYSDKFGASKNRVRWFEGGFYDDEDDIYFIVEEYNSFEHLWDILEKDTQEELMFYMELFSESVPDFIKVKDGNIFKKPSADRQK